MKTIVLNGYTIYLENITVTGGSLPDMNAESDWDFYGEDPEVTYDIVDVINSYGWTDEDGELITPTDADKNQVVLEMEDEITKVILADMQEDEV